MPPLSEPEYLAAAGEVTKACLQLSKDGYLEPYHEMKAAAIYFAAEVIRLRAELAKEKDDARKERLETAREHGRELREVAAESRWEGRQEGDYGSY